MSPDGNSPKGTRDRVDDRIRTRRVVALVQSYRPPQFVHCLVAVDDDDETTLFNERCSFIAQGGRFAQLLPRDKK